VQFVFDIQGRYLENAAIFRAAAEALVGLEPAATTQAALALVLVQLGWSYIRLGQLEAAQTALEQGAAIHRRSRILPPPDFATDPLTALGVLANIRGDYAKAAAIGEECRRSCQARGDNHNLQLAFYVLANAAFAQGDFESAQNNARQAHAVARDIGNRWFLAYVLSDQGDIARAMGDYAEAKQYYQDSYAIKREFGDPEGMASALNRLAKVASLQGNHKEAELLYRQSSDTYREISDRGGLATSLMGLGDTALALDDLQPACRFYCEALEISAEMRFAPLTLGVTTAIAELFARARQPERAAELLVFVLEEPAAGQETRDRAGQRLDEIRNQLPPSGSAAAVQRRSTDIDVVASSLLAELPALQRELGRAPAPAPDPAPGSPRRETRQPLIDPLTPRELEVLDQLCDGLTNREIAERLVISVGTVKSYTGHIYSKLGVRNRVQAVARARELELISN
jgi:ATP/maltotriose-dependent transcriptional regulator MalT